MKILNTGLAAGLLLVVLMAPARADENLLGYLAGAETLPAGAKEAYLWVTSRRGKGIGHYSAFDLQGEFEYGFTSSFQGKLAVKGLAVDTRNILIDAYIPGDRKSGPKLSGVEGTLKYRFLSPLINRFGLAGQVSLSRGWLDPYSGRDKNTTVLGLDFIFQKNFLDDQLISVINLGNEGTYADRSPIAGLPPGFEWPTEPEMEIEFKAGAGLSYRLAPRWFIGVETRYVTEFETEVGQERWSWHAGPSLHYASKSWWATLTWLRQLRGGGPPYAGQANNHLHLIEETRQEFRFKIGYNF